MYILMFSLSACSDDLITYVDDSSMTASKHDPNGEGYRARFGESEELFYVCIGSLVIDL